MALSKNTKLLVGDGGGTEVFTQITGITELSWDGVSWDTESTTNHDNATPVQTSVPTLYSNGNISLTILPYNAANTQHALLRSLSTTGAARNFQMHQVDNGEKSQFQGFVTNFAYVTPVDGQLAAEVTVMINGAFTPVA